MRSNIIPYSSCPSAEFLLGRLRWNSQRIGNIEFDHPDFQKRLAERNLTMRHVLETLRHGEVNDGPKQDGSGDWRIRVTRELPEDESRLLLAYKHDHFVAITVI